MLFFAQLILIANFLGCQTTSLGDAFITDGLKTGMTLQKVRELKGVPFEVELLDTGNTRYSYYYVLKNLTRDFTGQVRRIDRVPKQLNIYVNKQGIIENYEVIKSPALEEINDLINKAGVAYTKGDYKTALDLYAILLEKRPYLETIRKSRASVYVRYENDAEAQKDYTIILENNPNDWFSNHNRAVVFYQQKQYQESLDSFNKALTNQSDSVSSRAYRARTYLALGDKDSASKDIKFAKENGFVFTDTLKKDIEAYGVKV